MPKKAVTLKEDYAVATGTVRLTVLVGERQYGSSIVFLDDDLIANGDIDELPLGKGSELEGRTATVYTVVTDVRDRKKEMSVTWILTGGDRTMKTEKSGTVSKGFGSQMFKAVIDFVREE
jgi:hypothetical protein